MFETTIIAFTWRECKEPRKLSGRLDTSICCIEVKNVIVAQKGFMPTYCRYKYIYSLALSYQPNN
jgi:hypothetical protein